MFQDEACFGRTNKNEIFKTLEKVVDRLCDIICLLEHDTIKCITLREIGFYHVFKWCLVLKQVYLYLSYFLFINNIIFVLDLKSHFGIFSFVIFGFLI